MSRNSKIERYHGQGEGVNEKNIERYGYPKYSLYSTRRILSRKQQIEVTDEDGNVLYMSESEPMILLDKTLITDADGNEVARFERRPNVIREKHVLTMSSGMELLLEKEPLHIIKEITNIKKLDWQLKGNVGRLNFEIVDIFGQVVAVIGQKRVSKDDKYSIDIYQDECADVVACILIILMHIVRDRNIKGAAKALKKAGPQ